MVGEDLKPITIILMISSINTVSINTHFNDIIVLDTIPHIMLAYKLNNVCLNRYELVTSY